MSILKVLFKKYKLTVLLSKETVEILKYIDHKNVDTN